MKYSIVNYSNLEKTSRRFDPEYYHPNNLKLLKKLLSIPNQVIGDFAFVTDGIHESIHFDENSKINLISAKAPKENYFDLSGCGYISVLQDKKNPRTRLRENDIIISTVGTIGNCAVVDETILPANSDRHVGIVRINENFYPRFLSVFLLSKYGRFQTLRGSTGNVQLNLFIYKIKEIIVPFLSSSLQSQIENICIEAKELNVKASILYSQAEQLLLSELNLLNWKPKHRLSFVKNYSDTKTAGRIDGEYFQPMYEEIEKAIKSYSGGCSLIKDEFKQNKSTFKVEDQKEYNYVEIGSVNVSNGKVIPLRLEGLKLPANAKRVLKKGDVIISKVRTYRGAITVVEKDGYVGSGAFTVLKENGQINKETLFTFLHSKPLLAWSLKPNTGTSYPVITDEDILNMPIPILPIAKQKKIAEMVNKSFCNRKLSKQLLDIAKRGVEMAIEKNEKQAEKWIDKSVKKLGIKI